MSGYMDDMRKLGLIAPKGCKLRYFALVVATLDDGREVYATHERSAERWPLNETMRHGERRAGITYWRSAAERDAYAATAIPSGAERVEWEDVPKMYLESEIERCGGEIA